MQKLKKSVAKTKKKPSITKKTVASKSKVRVAKKVVAKRKTKKVLAIPKGYHSVIPYLIVVNASKAIEFYKKAFEAKSVMRMDQPGGKIGHAELKIGDSKIMLADEYPAMGAKGPKSFGGSPVTIHLYVKNVDAVVKRAVAAGAKLTRAVADMFYGDRSGSIEDPFGHSWYISTHVENVTPAQLKKRAAELFGK